MDATMNKARISTLWVGATMGMACGHAMAQSAVALYGIVDQSIRFTTNANTNNDSRLELTNGAITNSRFGLRGEENLGGGTKAIFRLENGFDPDTGMINQNGRLFGRFAYVGLSSQIGTIKLGRQVTEAFNLAGEFDPLTVGNYTANAWPYFLTGGRLDNAVSYEVNFGGLGFGATYGFGEQAGSMKQNAYWGLRTRYASGSWGLGAVVQQMRDASGNPQTMWGATGRYTHDMLSLFAGYMGGKDSTGVIDLLLNDPDRSVSYGTYQTSPRKDQILYAGLIYQATAALALTGAFYYDDMRNVNANPSSTGKRYTGVLLAEYALSKRTQIYSTVDFNKVSGGAETELPGRSNQFGAAVGIRQIF